MPGPNDDETFIDHASDYVETQDVYDLFSGLLQELVIHQPDNPLQFMVDKLQEPDVPKILIAGAPASGKGTQCEKIQELMDVVHISTGDLLRNAVANGTELGQKARSFMDAGQLVPDHITIELVKERLMENDCRQRGWLLDGFPRTRAQALALQSSGTIPTKFILLDIADELIVERVTGRRMDPQTGQIYHLKYHPPPAEIVDRLIQRSDDTADKVTVRLDAYHKNINPVVDCYRHILGRFNAAKSPDEVAADVRTFLGLQAKSTAPRKPHRIVVTGGPSSGRTTQAQLLKAQFGVLYVSIPEVVRVAIAQGDETGKKLAELEASGSEIPDELLVPLVTKKLMGQDARKHGYVLDGFPVTRNQATLLQEAGVIPTRCVLLDSTESVLKDRTVHRRVDPTDGKIYHLLDGFPDSETIRARVVQRPEDSPEAFAARMGAWTEARADLGEFYKALALHIEGDAAKENILERVVTFVENRLPKL